MKVYTSQFGELRLSFIHHKGNPEERLVSILKDLWKKELIGIEDGSNKSQIIDIQVDADLVVIDRILGDDRLRLMVDVGDRYTMASLISDDSEIPIAVFGTSYVHPSDLFNKESGRTIALERAIKCLPDVTEQTRRQILSGYYSR